MLLVPSVEIYPQLKNFQTFVESLKRQKNEVQVSYDVVNLFLSRNPSTSWQKFYLKTMNWKKNKTVNLIELCLSKCYFLWEDKIYQLKDSETIGLALMVVMAEGFLQHHERVAIELALTRNPPVAPKSFLRYVDDSHTRFDNTQSAIEFQKILNQQNLNIQYTMEAENPENSLQFLNMKITNTEGEYTFSIHLKNAMTKCTS